MPRHSRIALTVGLLLTAVNAQAQWSALPLQIPPEDQRVGAVCFKDGVLWVGTSALFYSLDTGKTWQSAPVTVSSGISSITFLDARNGVITTQSDGVFKTTDGGASWVDISPTRGVTFVQAAYGPTSSTIYVLEYNVSDLFTSTDGGASWSVTNFGTEGLALATGPDGTIYTFSSDLNGGWVNSSSDHGQTWSPNGNFTDGDCNAIAVDSCDPQRLYVINENTRQRTNGTTEIDISTDGGVNWTATATQLLDFYAGSIATTTQVLYVGTVPTGGDGVHRSTDHGLTWTSIGGPTQCFDTRTIAALDNNTVIVLDSSGTLWMTTNSGGHPVNLGPADRTPQLVVMERPQQFVASTCGPSDSLISIAVASCLPVSATLDSIKLSGSLAFTLDAVSPLPHSISGLDSIYIRYWPAQTNGDTSSLHLVYHLAGTLHDTTLTLIGSASLASQASTASQHPEYVTLTPGSSVNLPLVVDFRSQVNVDSISPFVQGVSLGIGYDSTKIQPGIYTPSSGWSVASPMQIGRAIEIHLHKFGQPLTNPLDLGTLSFRWDHPSRGYLLRLPLVYFVLHTTGGDVPLCVQQSEDNIWTVVVKATSGVDDQEVDATIRMFPDPVASRLSIENANEAAADVTILDELGRAIRTMKIAPSTTSSVDLASNPSSSYVVIVRVAERTMVRRIVRLR